MPAQRKTNQSRRLTAAGLIAVSAATLIVASLAVFASPALGVAGNCPVGGGWTQVQGSSGSVTVDGVTISWSGDSVTVSGGTATICVKAGNANSGVLTNFSGTYTMTCAVFGCNPQGQLPGISHIQYLVVTPSTTPPTTTPTSTTTTPTSTTTTPTSTTTTATSTTTTATTTTTTPGGGGGGGTTTTPPASTTPTTTPPIVAPTTVHNTSTTATAEVLPTTVRPGKLAFTGIEDVVPIGALALTLMTTGSGLLWAGSRRRRHDGSEDED
jgi:hypothetical protein